MSERDHASPSNQDDTQWDTEGIGRALGAVPDPLSDVALGGGLCYTIGPEQNLDLEIYPATQLARLTSRDAQLSLFRQGPPEIGTNGIIFQHHHQDHHLTLAILPEGQAVLSVGTKDLRAPQDALEIPAISPDSPAMPQPPEPLVLADSRAIQDHARQPVGSPRHDAETEQPRLTLHGRVGASPSFRTSRNGTLVAQFPLGVHEDADKTTWHTVVAFNDRAEKLKGSLKKGQPVEIIGYLHVKELKGKDGQPKRVEEVYATVIKQQ